MTKPLTIFNQSAVDQAAIDQLEVLMLDARAVAGALMGDAHLGYSMPIGGVIAYDNAISPSGVGYDIACGNMAVKTNLNIFDLGVEDSSGSDGHMVVDQKVLKAIMREIQRTVAFGMGRKNPTPVDHELFDDDFWTWIDQELPGLKDKARDQLGTVGSGNHYVDLLLDGSGRLWVANHFGSRGLGHTLATAFFAAGAGLPFSERVGEQKQGATIFNTDTFLGEQYVQAMTLAGRYAYAGREYVIKQVLGILGAEAVETVHNHHNYAWLENGLWVVRKGATPLTHEPAFIGGSMGDISVIVRQRVEKRCGQDSNPWAIAEQALGSAPHGAGRVMSRTKAAGKVRKMWICPNRNCDFAPVRCSGAESGYPSNHCPKCSIPLRRERVRDTSDAAIDWDATRADLTARGIVVLGAGADEAPGVYKNLGAVLAAHSNIEILEALRPIGVVMAGPDELDLYKD